VNALQCTVVCGVWFVTAKDTDNYFYQCAENNTVTSDVQRVCNSACTFSVDNCKHR